MSNTPEFYHRCYGPTQPAHSPGHVESEPNNEVATANIIGFSQLSGIVNSGTDRDDFFIYLIPATGDYTVLVTWLNSLRDIDLAVGWGDTGFDESTAVNTEFESVTQPWNAGDQLRILVRAFDTANIPVSYSLAIAAQ